MDKEVLDLINKKFHEETGPRCSILGCGKRATKTIEDEDNGEYFFFNVCGNHGY
jgi:hypothetical protein